MTNDKSIDGVLGTRTWGSRLVGTDESTELWRHLKNVLCLDQQNYIDFYQTLSLELMARSDLRKTHAFTQ